MLAVAGNAFWCIIGPACACWLLQAMLTFVKAPRSALLSYTALVTPEQLAHSKKMQHNALTYKASHSKLTITTQSAV